MKSILLALAFLQLFPLLTWGQTPIEYDFPEEKISIKTPADIISKRQAMIDYIWATNGWPTSRVPDRIDSNIIYTFYDVLKAPEGNLLRVDEYTVNMDNGFSAVLDHFIPINGNGKLFIYHSGHGYGNWWEDYGVNAKQKGAGLLIPGMLKLGYSVLATTMPLQGSPRPTSFPGDGELDWIFYSGLGHNQMFQYLDNPYTYFFDPLVITLNYLEDNYGYTAIDMAGLSGGGWTTTVYAALDERIRFSLPVAGSMPLYLRKGKEGYGDAEQGYDYSGLFGVANYLDMYVMGSYGKKHGQLQILNKYDNTCFYDGIRNLVWVDTVKHKMDELTNGRYNYFSEDSTLTHMITPLAYREMLKFINYYEKNDSLPLLISQQRIDTLVVGDSTSFEIAVRANNVSYLWQVRTNEGEGFVTLTDTVHYRGLTTFKLFIDSVELSMSNYLYRCIVAGDSIPTTSSYSLRLHILAPPQILTNPANLTLCPQEHASLTIAATGGELNYHWQLDNGSGFQDMEPGIAWSGVDEPTLDIWNNEGLDTKKFRCVVSNSLGESISEPAAFALVEPVAITVQPGKAIITIGDSVSFSVKTSGPVQGYQWQVRSDTAFVDIVDDEHYSGSSLADLVLNNPPQTFDQSVYRVVVKGPCDSLVTVPALLQIKPIPPVILRAPELVSGPADLTLCKNEPVAFTVEATGDDLQFRWQIDSGRNFQDLGSSPSLSGIDQPTLKILNTDGYEGRRFRCVVTNPVDTVTSESATFALIKIEITTEPNDAMITKGDSVRFAVGATGDIESYQWQVSPPGVAFTDLIDNEYYSGSSSAQLIVKGPTQTFEHYSFRCIVTGRCDSVASRQAELQFIPDVPVVVYNVTPDTPEPAGPPVPPETPIANGQALSLQVGVPDQGLEYTWQADKGNGFEDISNDDVFSGADEPKLTIKNVDKVSGYSFRCLLAESDNQITSQVYTVIVAPFNFVMHPANTTGCIGEARTFTVATEAAARAYRWQVDRADGLGFVNLSDGGTRYQGQGTSTLEIKQCAARMNGFSYRCVATNSAGNQIVSNGASLSVDQPVALDFGLDALTPQCSKPLDLVPNFPGGVFEGKGVSRSTFDPGKADLGYTQVSYTYVDRAGCKSRVEKTTLVHGCDQESKYLYNIVASPNPSGGMVNVTFDGLEKVSVRLVVYNSLGQPVYFKTRDVSAGSQLLILDLTSEPRGTYVIVLYCGEEAITIRIVIQ